MKIWVYLVNSLFLAVCLVGSLPASNIFIQVFLSPMQISFQTPIAIVIGIGFFILWVWLSKRFLPERILLINRKDYLLAYLLSFLWTPLILLVVQNAGLTWFNLVTVWWFQFPVGLVAEMLAAYIFRAESIPTRHIFRR
jgi:hypothetical protein